MTSFPTSRRPLYATAPWLIFVSHTTDLLGQTADGSFVDAAQAAIVRAGHAIMDMAYFTARDMEPAEYCRRMVMQADVYVGLIGRTYGSVVQDRPDRSYTELEFEVATEEGIPRLVFLIDEDLTRPGVEPPAFPDARQAEFRRRLQRAGLTTASVASPAELEIKLHQALVELRMDVQAALPPPPRILHPASPAPHPAVELSDRALVPLWMRLEQPEIGDAIALLRASCGFTRSQLVQRMWDVTDDREIRLDTSLVYRWERGEKGRPRTRPSDRYRRLLGLVCEREVGRMGTIRRREFLQQLAVLAAPPLLLPPTHAEPGRLPFVSSADGRVLDGLDALTMNYLRLHNTVSPSAVRSAIGRHFEDLTALALRSHGPATAARVRSMAAQTGILAGWVAFNLQDLSQALMYWVVAHDLAREAGNVSLQAHAMGARSRLHSPIHRDPGEADAGTALALLDQAVRLGQSAASPALRSWLLANRAQQLAASGQADASRRDLEAAARLASLKEQAEGDVLSGWDEVRVDAYRGICEMVLGRPKEVIEITEPVLARMEGGRVQRPLQQSDLAAAYAQRGEVERACALLGEALTASRRAEFPEGVRRALGVRAKHLGEHAGAHAVQKLDQLIAADPN